MTFWAVFLWILEYFFQISQNSTTFYIYFHKIDPFLHVYYTKFNENFSFFENFGFLQKFPVGIGFFQSIMVVNIIFDCWKVENVLSNKVDITSYSWTVWVRVIELGRQTFMPIQTLDLHRVSILFFMKGLLIDDFWRLPISYD